MFELADESEASPARRAGFPRTLRGTVETMVFQSDEFSVASFRPDGELLPVRITGPLPGVTSGMELLLSGQWTNHAKYGEQFKVESFALEIPRTRAGLARYLGSGLLPGIGPALAERIVAQFGLNALDVLNNHIDRLRQVSGIGKKNLEKIKAAWASQRQIAGLMSLLMELGAGSALAARIHKEYGADAEQVVKLTPYRLTEVRGVGFLTADRIAQAGGIPSDAPERIEAGLVHALGEMSVQGHTCAPRGTLVQAAIELLAVEADWVQAALDRLVEANRLRCDPDIVIEEDGEPDEALYLPWLYRAEEGIAARLLALAAVPSTLAINTGNLPRKIAGVTLSDRQRAAVTLALSRKVVVITGGPGTGKTTIIRSILAVLADAGIAPTLAAPTGRAAKRMTEVCGYEARTIHRLLGTSGPGHFQFDEETPLPVGFLIIDEMSMVDIQLFYALLRALPPAAHLIIVGDADQLPSVGPGNVLRDLVESGAIPTALLDAIFRQAEDSSIIANAHRINQGNAPLFPQDIDDDPRRDFFFFSASDPAQAGELITSLVSQRIPQLFRVAPTDIQVLSPLRRNGEAATNALNRRLQAALNPPRPGLPECRAGDRTYRVGDRIIQTRNDYDRQVFNGESGVVMAIDITDRQLTATFDDAPAAVYSFDDLADNIDLAYALTIHKSQGSEYPVVVMPMLTAHFMMLRRNLLYTGVTRARQMVVLVGQRQAINLAVSEGRRERRYAGLRWRLGGR